MAPSARLVVRSTPIGLAVAERRRSANRRCEDGLGSERDEVFLSLALGHAGATRKKRVDVTLHEDGREETRHGETHSVLGERHQYLRETSRYVGHLNPQRDRAFTQV